MTSSHPSPPLDPDAGAAWRSVLTEVMGGRAPRVDAESLPTLRDPTFDSRAALLLGRDHTDRELVVPGPAGDVAVSLFTPVDHAGPAPGIFWIHGGGLVAGDRWGAVEALDAATPVGGVVASVEYRLAPEHPAPAPLDDCVAALGWVAEHAAELGIDPDRLVLGGASAGAGLAAAAALRSRDEGGPPLAALVLCSPMLDDRMVTVSSRQVGDDVVWTRASNEFGWRALLGERAGTDDVTIYEAPGRATDLSGLPPTFLDVGSADLFRDETVAFAAMIWACGGVAELHVWPGAFHGSETLAPEAPLSVESAGVRRRWLARRLAQLAT